MRLLPAAALLLILLLSGCGEPGAVFPKPIREVREILLSLTPPTDQLGGASLKTPAASLAKGSIVWTVFDSNRAKLRFIAKVSPVDAANTRVSIEVTGPTDAADDPTSISLDANPDKQQHFLTAMAEQIAARMENRPYDVSRVSGATEVEKAANIGRVSRRMDMVGEEGMRQDEANVKRAYDRENRAGWNN